MKIIFTLLTFLVFLSANAQESIKVDSLINAIKNSTKPEVQIDLLIELGVEYSNIKSDSLLSIANHLLKISKSLKDNCAMAIGYHYRANYYENRNDIAASIKENLKALEIREKHCEKDDIGSSYLQLGNDYSLISEYDKASEYYYKCLAIAEETNDYSLMSRVHLNLGLLNVSRDRFPKAREHYWESLKYIDKENDSILLGNLYNNIGGYYEAQEIYDTALTYFQAAMDIYAVLDHKSGLAHGYNNMGIIHYFRGFEDSSMIYFNKSLEMRKQIGEKGSISQSYNNIGILNMYMGNYKIAITYSDSALQLALEINSKEEVSDAYESLYEIYYEAGDYKNAFNNLKFFNDYKDTLDSEQSKRIISELETKYNTAEKEKEIQQKNLDIQQKTASIKRQNLIIWGSITVGMLLALLFIVFFSRNRITKKQNAIIKEQNRIVEQKQREIIDSIKYAKRIQDALLKNEEHESEHLPEHFVLYKPKDIVSGDFYWVHEKDDYLYIAVADCTGHGVPGAFLTMLGTSFLNEINTCEKCLSPAEILDQLRDKILMELSQKGSFGDSQDGMDISLVQFNIKTKKLIWAGANNPLWIVKNKTEASEENELNGFIEIKPDKQPIGFYHKMTPFTNQTIQLSQGDLFYLLSDGYADQFGGPKVKKFKYKPLKKLLLSFKSIEMSSQKRKLDEVFIDWKGELEQIDDVCIIGIRI